MKTRTGYLLKRGRTFYACWAVAGKKFRQSTHTADRRQATTELARIMRPFLVADEVRTLETVKARIEGAKTELAVYHEERNPPVTIRQAWAVYLASPNRPDTGPRGLTLYEGIFNRFATWMEREHPETKALRNVTEEQAEAYASNLAASRMTGATFNHHLGLLKLTWRVLRKKARVERNPWEDIPAKRIVTRGRRELTIEELRDVCGAATGEMRTLFALGLYSGMRLGDCATLRWAEVDLVRGIIRRVPNKTARRKPCTEIIVEDASANLVSKFVEHLERVRKNSVCTRNVRLAAIHSFFRYLATTDPRYMDQCRGVLGVPFKRQAHRVPEYLEREEVLSIFRHVDSQTPLGLRDEAILRLLYNTGMRASELVDLNTNHVRFTRPHYVRIHGKGHKERTCPLWQETIKTLTRYVEARSLPVTDTAPLFVNANGERLTRFGLRYVVGHRAAAAAATCSTLLSRRVTPHTFRHTTAMHLLQSGTEFNMIRSWLGHSSIETTHVYAEIDLDMKRKTLQACEKLLPKTGKHGPTWRRDADVLEWLSQL